MKTSQKSYQEAQENSRNRLIFKEKLIYIIGVPVITLLLTLFVFHFYRIDGPSMEETLHHKDVVIVEKLGKTWAKITGSLYIPKRYDVIVFKNPNALGEKELIKRVIALPGERVAIVNNDVRVFNESNPEGLLVDWAAPAEAGIDDITAGYIDQILGPGEIFVLGDNRDGSYDSRDFGPLNTETIVGVLTVRLYPIGNITFY